MVESSRREECLDYYTQKIVDVCASQYDRERETFIQQLIQIVKENQQELLKSQDEIVSQKVEITSL